MAMLDSRAAGKAYIEREPDYKHYAKVEKTFVEVEWEASPGEDVAWLKLRSGDTLEQYPIPNPELEFPDRIAQDKLAEGYLREFLCCLFP